MVSSVVRFLPVFILKHKHGSTDHKVRPENTNVSTMLGWETENISNAERAAVSGKGFKDRGGSVS